MPTPVSQEWWHVVADEVTFDSTDLPLPIQLGLVVQKNFYPTEAEMDALFGPEDPDDDDRGNDSDNDPKPNSGGNAGPILKTKPLEPV